MAVFVNYNKHIFLGPVSPAWAPRGASPQLSYFSLHGVVATVAIITSISITTNISINIINIIIIIISIFDPLPRSARSEEATMPPRAPSAP